MSLQEPLSDIPAICPKPAVYRIPIVRIEMVREKSVPSDVRIITGPRDVSNLLMSFLSGADREHLVVVLLNTKNRVVAINTASIGDLDSSIANPREVFKPAILANAASIILGHNHPSGDCTPSSADVSVTKRMVSAGEILGITVLDHIVIGDGCFASLRERGLM